MKIGHVLLLALVSTVTQAAPFLVSDPIADTRPTHCALYLDAEPRVLSPVVSSPAGKACKIDVLGTKPGMHKATAAFVAVDPVWGETEGLKSDPLSFTGPPSITGVPVGLKLQP